MKLTLIAFAALGSALCTMSASAHPDHSEAARPAAGLSCIGATMQGGLIVCETRPGTTLVMNGSAVATADENGRAAIGLATNAPASAKLSALMDGNQVSRTFEIATRNDEYRELTGLDCDKVDARTEEQKNYAGRSWVKKQKAFEQFEAGPGANEGFIRPTDGIMSSPFGPTRRYTGVSKVTGEACDKTSVHRGYDMAVGIGTPVKAPAAGVITLADPDLYYEGGTVFLDHGQGLVSIFMHLSEVDVKVGDVVQAGDVVAKSGNTGRTTGPHLHWAVKWRNTASDNRDGDFYIDPALLLEL